MFDFIPEACIRFGNVLKQYKHDSSQVAGEVRLRSGSCHSLVANILMSQTTGMGRKTSVAGVYAYVVVAAKVTVHNRQ